MESRGLAEAMWKMGADAGMTGIWFAAVTLRKRGILNCDMWRRWYLKQSVAGGVLWHGHVWGPRELFTVMERAAYRRRGVMEILRAGAKSWAKIAEGLMGGGWEVGRPSVAVVRADLRRLGKKGLVKRVATEWRWGLV